MTRSSKPLPLLPVVLFGGFLSTTSLLSLTCYRSLAAPLQASPKALVDQVWQIVNQEYVDSTFNHTNWQAVRQRLLSQNYTSRAQAYAAIQAELKQLGDPYTRFLDPQDYAQLMEETSGELSGIGVEVELDTTTKRLTIVRPLANSPAIKAGLRPGDWIIAIDGQPLQGMSEEAALKLIGGRVATPITLLIERQGQGDFAVKLRRAKIELPTVSYALKPDGKEQIGYIHLTEFDANSATEMRRAIATLKAQHVDGYILDLRGNPGGLVDAAVAIARMWLPSGMIVRAVDRTGASEEIKANHRALTKRPLVVLVDGDSASASEILTGALQDNHRAEVVGSETFGKALIQDIQPLADGSGLAVTIEHYFTPNGSDINHRGITPDIQSNITQAQQQRLADNPALLTTQTDVQYLKATDVLNLQLLSLSNAHRR